MALPSKANRSRLARVASATSRCKWRIAKKIYYVMRKQVSVILMFAQMGRNWIGTIPKTGNYYLYVGATPQRITRSELW
jgi:hypothetical protein